jgi:hypothetical protein
MSFGVAAYLPQRKNPEANLLRARGMMMMNSLTTGIHNSTPQKSDKPWIHVRAALIDKFWTGLAIFSANQMWTDHDGDQQYPFANAAGA